MTRRPDSIDYAAQCTICIDYEESGVANRIVYERPQMQLPERPLTAFERMKLSQYPDDEALTIEAKAIFADMRRTGRISQSATLGSIFIARTSAAAVEMNL
ncbi:hypothetical protein JOD63_002632 [Microbacterium terrae]|nr:hypothetical protein [Microbacterium terrae]MBP1078664.1 hypothetical protein [Microbacterium terrae]